MGITCKSSITSNSSNKCFITSKGSNKCSITSKGSNKCSITSKDSYKCSITNKVSITSTNSITSIKPIIRFCPASEDAKKFKRKRLTSDDNLYTNQVKS